METNALEIPFSSYFLQLRLLGARISLLLPPLSLFPPYWIASLCSQIDVTGCCHVFWPCDLNAIFRGKTAQL